MTTRSSPPPRPFLDPALEDGERHGAVLEHFVEALEVEAGAERDLGLRPRPGPGHVADLVAARLPDLGAIALDLALRARPGEAGRLDQVVGRLLAAPFLGVEAGVDDEARRPEQEGLEEAGAAQGIALIDPELVGELFGVERPAFRISAEEACLAKGRDVLRLLREADLEVVARDPLVIAQG